MIDRVYRSIHRFFSEARYRGEYSGGKWQEDVRRCVLGMRDVFSGRLLEVGCGEGLFLREAAARYPGIECWGGDNHQGRIARAQENAQDARIAVMDARMLPFPEGSFSAVVCLNVIFNMPSFEAVSQTIAEMARVCRTGGRVVLDYRCARNPLLLLKYSSARLYDPTVRRLPLKTYSDAQIRGLLDRGGLAVRAVKTIDFPPLCPAIVIIEAEKR